MLQVSENAKRKMYESFGRTEETAEDDVIILKTWIKSQPHLPEVMEDVKIKNFLNLNKFSIEKTKEKIDMYYTIRSVIPELFDKFNPKHNNPKKFFEEAYLSILPKPLNDAHRIYFFKPKLSDLLDPVEVVRFWFALFEIRLREDFMIDDVIVVDWSNLTFTYVKRCTPSITSKFVTIYKVKKVYALRMKKIIFVNSPSYITAIVAILKTLLPPKIFHRMEVHGDDSILKEDFPKELIPKDYGGDGPSLDELNEMMQKKLIEHQDHFDRLDTLRVNEKLRPEKLDNDEILGFYGSFKKMNVD